MEPQVGGATVCFGPVTVYEDAENLRKRLNESIKQIEEGKAEANVDVKDVERLLDELDAMASAADYAAKFINELGANLGQPLLTFLRRICIVPGLGAWAAMNPMPTGFEIYLDRELALKLDKLKERRWAIAAINFALWHELIHLEFNTRNMSSWLADLSILKTKYSQDALERIGEILMEILVNEKVYSFYELGVETDEPLVRGFAMKEPYKFIMPVPGVFWGVCHTDVIDVSKTYLDKAKELAERLDRSAEKEFTKIFLPYFERGDICHCVQDWFANVRAPTSLSDVINLLTTDLYLQDLINKTDYKEKEALVHANDIRFDELVFLIMMTCRVDYQSAVNIAKDLAARNALIYKVIEGKLTLYGKRGGSCDWPYKRVQMFICGGGICEDEKQCKRRKSTPPPPIDKPPSSKSYDEEEYKLNQEFKLRRLRLIPEQPQSEPITGLEGTPERPKWIER
jgi:hypothetical protein